MKKLLLLIGITILSLNTFAQTSAEDILAKAKSLILNSKGITAEFSIDTNGNINKGSLKSQGEKFTVTLPGVQVWFNGKYMYTYNSRTQETTVTDPTPDELAEVNPLEYVKGASKNFTAKFSSRKTKGVDIIDLLPKNKRSEIKNLTISVNSSNYKLSKISGVTTSGDKISITIDSFNTNAAIDKSEFEYPASKYKGVEIIDLR